MDRLRGITLAIDLSVDLRPTSVKSSAAGRTKGAMKMNGDLMKNVTEKRT
jgi:hypothetical protein